MTLLDYTGWDLGDHALRSPYQEGANTTVASSRGGRALQLVSTGYIIPFPVFTPAAEVFVGCAVKVATIDATARGIIALFSDGAGSRHLSVGLTSAGVVAHRGFPANPIIGQSPGGTVFSAGTWYYIEIRFICHDSTGRLVVKVNGVTHIDFTGDTRNGGTSALIDSVALQANSAIPDYDDLYVCNALGSAPYNTFLATHGNVLVGTPAPTGAGNSTQMAPSAGSNWQCVDEQPYSTADFVTGDAGEKDTYAMADLPVTAETILAVRPCYIAKKSDAAVLSGRTVVRSGGADHVGSTVALTTADKTYSTIYTTDPATSAAWTVAGVNALEVGAEAV